MADNQVIEVESDSSVAEAGLTFPLDDLSSFVLFGHLNSLKDCMNLVDAYPGLQPVAERIYKKKFNKLTFDFQQPIDRTLLHAGAFAKSLTLSLHHYKYNSGDLGKIRYTCQQLRCLSVTQFQRKKFLFNPFAHFGNGKLEELTLSNCSLGSDIFFFSNYRSLKCLNMFNCYDISSNTIERCFKNNQGITSFTCNNALFKEPEMLLFLPNLERLSLAYESFHMRFDILSQLPSLRYLTLNGDEDNINDVLADVGTINRLEELHLREIDVDEETFPLIKSLQNLKLLSVISICVEVSIPKAKDLPPNLKTLKLEGFEITDGNIESIVEKLVHLENLFLRGCGMFHDDDIEISSDFDLIADLIIEDLKSLYFKAKKGLTDANLIHRSLIVTIEADYEETPNTTKSIGRVRITNDVRNTSLFETSYPGMYRWIPECEVRGTFSD